MANLGKKQGKGRTKKLVKPTKTISGVAPVAVMLPPKKCEHGACLYCPTLNAPQSYTPESPAVLRARSVDYDSFLQVKKRVDVLEKMGHNIEKVELIIMGGTFLQYDRDFQFNFIKGCYDALNSKRSKNLAAAKKLNEKAKRRCVALCIETRPDVCTDKHIRDMLDFGATRVELGVQAIDDKIYEKVNRGHKVKDVVFATEKLKKAGFKIGYHLMPGIYGSNLKKDIKMFKEIFNNQDFKPDQIKIYPCQVLKGSALEKIYYEGGYIPYTKEIVKELVVKFLSLTPRYCRVMRVMREIPPFFLVQGIKNIDLRSEVEEEIRKKKIKINEIRFREIGFALRDGRKIDSNLKIKKTVYSASNGREIFLEVVNDDGLLFGLLRLRLEKSKDLKDCAMVRELHVYGPALKLSESGAFGQHTGLGRMLLKESEKISSKKRCKKIRIISGVGVREYYRKLGYALDSEEVYMEKEL